MDDRIPPHHEEAEQALLGAILVNNRAFERVGEFLKPEHFFHPPHALIYRAASVLIGRNEVANPLTLRGHFEGTGELVSIGGVEYLGQLAVSIVTIHNAGDYGRVILDCWLRRQAIEIAESTIAQAYKRDVEIPAETILSDAESALYDISTQASVATSRTKTAGKAAAGALEWIAEAQRDGGTVGLSTGLLDLDYRLAGLRPGNLLVIGGRPGMGKSSLLRNIAYANGCQNIPVGLLSLEMSAEEMGFGFLAQLTGIATDDQLSGRVDQGQINYLIEAQQHLDRLPIHIDDTAALTASIIAQKARRLHRQYGIQLLGIDHLHFAKVERRNASDNRAAQIGDITAACKALAKDLKIPVILLSQLNRGVESRDDKRPTLQDLRESGAVEQDADGVVFVYREEYYLENAPPRHREGETDGDFLGRTSEWETHKLRVQGLAELIVAKVRMGRRGTALAQWSGIRQQFSNLAREHEGGR